VQNATPHHIYTGYAIILNQSAPSFIAEKVLSTDVVATGTSNASSMMQ
jgi:hypothetical protein